MKTEQIVSPRVEIAEKIHEELLVSLELERKFFSKLDKAIDSVGGEDKK